MNQPRKKLPVYLSAKEMERLLAGVHKDRHRLGLALMAYGGLRVSEMCKLKIENINLARGYMKITGKGDKQRIVPLNARLTALIEKYLTRYGARLTPDDYILGKTRASWHYVVKKYSSQVLGRSDLHCPSLPVNRK